MHQTSHNYTSTEANHASLENRPAANFGSLAIKEKMRLTTCFTLQEEGILLTFLIPQNELHNLVGKNDDFAVCIYRSLHFIIAIGRVVATWNPYHNFQLLHLVQPQNYCWAKFSSASEENLPSLRLDEGRRGSLTSFFPGGPTKPIQVFFIKLSNTRCSVLSADLSRSSWSS